MHIHQRYVHILHLPLMPAGRTGRSRCSYCQDNLNDNQMLPVLKKAYESVKRRTRVPMWTYCGSMLLVLITASSFFVSQRHVFQTASMARSPEAGDIIKIRRDSGTYTLYKVMTTTPDSAYLLMSQYETNLVSGLMTIKRKGPSAYLSTPVGLSRKDLKIWLDEGLIVGIERQATMFRE